MEAAARPAAALPEGAADWCLGTVDFLDFPTLGAYLASCRQCLRLADAPSVWEGWRSRCLDLLVPGHVRWSSAEDGRLAALGSGLLRARCAYNLARGVRLYEERLFAPAEAALRAALAELPRHEQLSCRLADVLYGQAVELRAEEPRPPGAEPRPQSAVAPAPAREGGAATGAEESLAERRDGLMAEARRLYEEVLALNPENSYAINGLALFADDGSEKRRLLERAVELDGDNPYALANLASCLAGSDDRRAVECLDRALAVNPRLFYARLFKSRTLWSLGNIDGAIDAAREHLQWRPGDASAGRLLAQMERQRLLIRRQLLLV